MVISQNEALLNDGDFSNRGKKFMKKVTVQAEQISVLTLVIIHY
jgi:hypothetical protein